MGFPFPFRLVTLLLAARPAGFRGPRSDFFWACGKPYIIVYGHFGHRIWSARRAPQTASTNRRAAKYGQNFSRSEDSASDPTNNSEEVTGILDIVNALNSSIRVLNWQKIVRRVFRYWTLRRIWGNLGQFLQVYKLTNNPKSTKKG